MKINPKDLFYRVHENPLGSLSNKKIPRPQLQRLLLVDILSFHAWTEHLLVQWLSKLSLVTASRGWVSVLSTRIVGLFPWYCRMFSWQSQLPVYAHIPHTRKNIFEGLGYAPTIVSLCLVSISLLGNKLAPSTHRRLYCHCYYFTFSDHLHTLRTDGS